MRTSPIRPAGSFLAASTSRNLEKNPSGLVMDYTYLSYGLNYSEKCFRNTHDDFPLPVAPMMAFKPGFIIPLL